MIRPLHYSNPHDRETLRTVFAFLNKRLAEQGTIDWALKLRPEQTVERIAVNSLLSDPSAGDLAEPWASAWRFIEESWSVPPSEGSNGTAAFGIQQRLRTGDRSGAVIAAIVDLVAPRLKVEPINAWRHQYMKKPRRPKSVEHILSATLTSGDLVDLNVLELASLDSIPFLTSLASALEAAVKHGIDVARRLGWDGSGSSYTLGFLNRAYYTRPTRLDSEDEEPDAYHHGIAPSVKLLHAVVSRLADLEAIEAQSFVRRWHAEGPPLFVRLWAAMARSNQLVGTEVVASFLQSLDDRHFWNLHSFPEIAELRALRFRDFDLPFQERLATRLKKGPPRGQWPRKADQNKVANAREYWALRELRRVEVAGAVLPASAKRWLSAREQQYPDLAHMTIAAGFPEGVTASYVRPNPDSQYDTLQGCPRLQALESALAASRGSWDDDPAERANDWINQHGGAEKLVADFEAAANGGDNFPKVWNRFGWAHRPCQQDGDVAQNANQCVEAERVLNLLNQLSTRTTSSAIEGLCTWFDTWKKQIVKLPLALPIWHRLWPIAVEATNRTQEKSDHLDLNVTGHAADDAREPMDLDTFNTPAGKLVSVFLAACPPLSLGAQTVPKSSIPWQMRDIIAATEGRSGLIGKHRMIEALPYFLRADPDWAQVHLVAPLYKDDAVALTLWRAVARRTHSADVLKILGAAMVERASDRRLGRETRRRLVFSLVVESLHAYREDREPAVPKQRIQQMLRTLDDELRASAADVIPQFVRELSATAASSPPELDAKKEHSASATAAAVFRAAAEPFLREVWPQERSLATPGVSGALADLPATSEEAFTEAVDTIARFLVPFECWSMLDYGLFGGEGDAKKLSTINDKLKASGLLRLLDLTVGNSEGAVVPYDLTDALDQISKVDPALATTATFRRLATAARRW